MKKNIIVIDDEPLITVLIKEIIEEDDELQVTSEVDQKDKFLGLVRGGSFDAALIDISISGQREGGLDLLKILKNNGISVPAIILSAHNEIDYALKCLQCGAKGYVSKNHICTDIVRALKEVLRGNLFVSGNRGPHIINEYKASLPSPQPAA